MISWKIEAVSANSFKFWYSGLVEGRICGVRAVKGAKLCFWHERVADRQNRRSARVGKHRAENERVANRQF